jgi:ribosomal protein S18 acetylase RimI-like enzyme|tara:strand:- start:242 stop:682 length:441 start_codon:yes stop_codon:yes gene_type:complete
VIKLHRYLDNYQFYNTCKEVQFWNQLIPKDTEDKLSIAIEEFQRELNWDGMWSISDAYERLSDGWCLSVLNIDDKVRGWSWLNYHTKEYLNLYVHKDFRNKGYGFNLVSSGITAGKLRKLDYLWSEVDDWNINSINLLKKCGYEIQ